MTSFLNVILVIYGFIQGTISAFMLAQDPSLEGEEIRETKESMKMIGLHSFTQQKQMLMGTFQLGAILRFLFSIPALLYFYLENVQLGLIVTSILIILDIIKTIRSYLLLKKSKTLETILKSKVSSKVIHIFRLLLKAIIIAILLSKGA